MSTHMYVDEYLYVILSLDYSFCITYCLVKNLIMENPVEIIIMTRKKSILRDVVVGRALVNKLA